MQAIIFDLDGTLAYTKPEYRYAVVGRTLDEFGKVMDKAHVDRFWVESKRDVIIKNCFGLDPSVFWPAFRRCDSIDIRKSFTHAYQDTHVLRALKDEGYKLAIVTGAPLHIAEMEIEIVGRDLFDVIVVANHAQGIIPKPHPQGLNRCLSLLGVRAEEAIFVGNGNEDIACARNAGVVDVFIDRKEHEFLTEVPAYHISTLADIPKMLETVARH